MVDIHELILRALEGGTELVDRFGTLVQLGTDVSCRGILTSIVVLLFLVVVLHDLIGLDHFILLLHNLDHEDVSGDGTD